MLEALAIAQHEFSDPSFISLHNPFEAGWHFAGLELVVYVCFGLTIWHAWTRHRAGDSFHLFQWIALFIYGLIMELLAFNFMQNYAHAAFSVQLYHGELPLYITCMYLVFHYTGIKMVERLGLPLLKGGILAGLAIVFIDIPFDSLGVDAGWWIWADNTETALHPRFVEAVATRWYGVPITSYYWYLMYGAMLYIFTHALYPKLKTRSLGSRLACAPLVSIAVCVAGALAFELMFWLPRGLGVSEHVIVATWFAVVLALAAMVRAPAARPPERWLVINVVLFHAFHLLVMVWLWSAGRLTNTTGKLLLITAAVAVALTILKGLPLRGHVRSTR
jgi:hypothetical protein